MVTVNKIVVSTPPLWARPLWFRDFERENPSRQRHFPRPTGRWRGRGGDCSGLRLGYSSRSAVAAATPYRGAEHRSIQLRKARFRAPVIAAASSGVLAAPGIRLRCQHIACEFSTLHHWELSFFRLKLVYVLWRSFTVL